jgi:hypothetical protein
MKDAKFPGVLDLTRGAIDAEAPVRLLLPQRRHATHRRCGSGFSRDAPKANEDASEHEAQVRLRFQQGVLIPEDEEIGKQLIYPF